MNNYIVPKAGLRSFTCPHCHVVAQQTWRSINFDLGAATGQYESNRQLNICVCTHCEKAALWIDSQMVYPDRALAPWPHGEMPEEVKSDYEEAASIVARSPRGASALLRLAVQNLCRNLGGTGENLNSDIAKLVTQGLPARVQRSLDVVRVTGNHAVHPGQIETDDPQVATTLFELINIIVEQMVAIPKRVDSVYNALPEGAKEQIERRDKPK